VYDTVTVPAPLPDDPAVMVIHPLALDADQLHPGGAPTVRAAVPASPPTARVDGATVICEQLVGAAGEDESQDAPASSAAAPTAHATLRIMADPLTSGAISGATLTAGSRPPAG
jgi:hypothetical protein